MEGTTRNVQQCISVIILGTSEAISDPIGIFVWFVSCAYLEPTDGVLAIATVHAIYGYSRNGTNSETEGWKLGFDEESQRKETATGSFSVPVPFVPHRSPCGYLATGWWHLRQMSRWRRRRKSDTSPSRKTFVRESKIGLWDKCYHAENQNNI